MNCHFALSVFLFGYAASSIFAQHRVDPRDAYVRILAVVPLIGAGTHTDPIRPAYAPGPRQRGLWRGGRVWIRLEADGGIDRRLLVRPIYTRSLRFYGFEWSRLRPPRQHKRYLDPVALGAQDPPRIAYGVTRLAGCQEPKKRSYTSHRLIGRHAWVSHAM